MSKNGEIVTLVLWVLVVVLVLRWLSSRGSKSKPKVVIDRQALEGIDDVAAAPITGVWDWGVNPDQPREVFDPDFLAGLSDVAKSWGT